MAVPSNASGALMGLDRRWGLRRVAPDQAGTAMSEAGFLIAKSCTANEFDSLSLLIFFEERVGETRDLGKSHPERGPDHSYQNNRLTKSTTFLKWLFGFESRPLKITMSLNLKVSYFKKSL